MPLLNGHNVILKDISKSIIARSFKLGQLIVDNKWINYRVNIKKCILFFQVIVLVNLETSITITTRSFKLGQLIDYLVKILKKLFFFELLP